MKENSANKILFFGDELLSGVGDPIYAGWVNRVLSRSKNPRNYIVMKSIIPSDNTILLRKRWEDDFALRCNGGSKVVIQLSNKDIDVTSSVRSRLNLATVLDDIKKKTEDIFVVGPIQSSPEKNQKIEQLSDTFKNVADRRKIPYVDLFHSLIKNEKWNEGLKRHDYLFPSQEGYELMSWVILNNQWIDWFLK